MNEYVKLAESICMQPHRDVQKVQMEQRINELEETIVELLRYRPVGAIGNPVPEIWDKAARLVG